MTHNDKISYMKVACGIVGYRFDPKGLDMLVSVYDEVLKKGGDADLKGIIDIQLDVERKHKEIELEKNTPKVWK